MNKEILIIGGGSKFGASVTHTLLELGYEVNLITGSTVQEHPRLNQIKINWNTLTVASLKNYLENLNEQKLVFFNQNSSALSVDCYTKNHYDTSNLWKQQKHWSQSYFISCILPFHIIHTLQDRCNIDTRIIWMLSNLIYKHHAQFLQYGDYIGNKTTNHILMKNFSINHSSCFFGLNPDDLDNTPLDLKYLLDFILSTDTNLLNGRVFKLSGQEDKDFWNFDL